MSFAQRIEPQSRAGTTARAATTDALIAESLTPSGYDRGTTAALTALEGTTMSLLTLLRESGNVTIGDVAVTRALSFTQRVYNALNNGHDSVIVLTHNGATLADSLTESGIPADSIFVSDERKRGTTEYRDVKDVLGAIERRNAANPKHVKSTFGTVNVPADAGIYDGDALVGFVVEVAN